MEKKPVRKQWDVRSPTSDKPRCKWSIVIFHSGKKQKRSCWTVKQRVAHLGSWQRDLIDLDDWAHNPLRWSDEMFRLLGYSVGEVEASRANFDRAIHPEDLDRIRELMSAVIRDRRPYSADYRVILPNGIERNFHSQADFVYDETTKKPLKIVGVVQDVTDRKRI